MATPMRTRRSRSSSLVLQLVMGVVEEVNRDNVFAKAIDELGWGVDNIDEIAGEGVVS